MKISYNLLNQFIHLEESPDEVGKILTGIGLEVEGIQPFESLKGGLKGLITGHVVEVWKHPNADKLNCTKVDIGSDSLLSIVCGAPNVAQGQKVIVAPVGTILYTTSGDRFEIKKAKIRGEVSEGMICAEDEIGVGKSHDGILVLPEDTPIGIPAQNVFDIYTDHVFEIGLTPNRADAASHLGVARDLKAAKIHRNGKNPKLCRPSVDDFEPDNNDLQIMVEVQNTEACPRYVGVSITGVTVKDSPIWLQNTLKSIGIRPINNVVDITNYINHAFGQPMHAFDADKIRGGKVVVRTCETGTKFVSLDGEERSLDQSDLMICDTDGPMCIAGVFGGAHSGVTHHTTNVFLESAFFHPVWVRKTAKRHGLNTDASFRFERGIDPNITAYCGKLGASMVKSICGGKISSPLFDTHSSVFEDHIVDYDLESANRLIGINIPEHETQRILEGLEIGVLKKQNRLWTLRVPPFKVDVTRQADVVEEVLRIYGYDEVPVSQKMHSSISDLKRTQYALAREAVTKMLTSEGFLECMSNSMTNAKYAELSKAWQGSEVVELSNALSSELGIMRPALVFSALENTAYNLNRQQNSLQLFEFGNVYRNTNTGFTESEHLGILVCGQNHSDHWRGTPQQSDWYTLKATFERICYRLGVDLNKLSVTDNPNDWFAYGMQWGFEQHELATAGLIGAQLSEAFELKKPVYYLEVNWRELVNLRNTVIQVGQLPKYPEVRRDLALLVSKDVTYEKLEKLAYASGQELLKNVQLFDVFQGKGLPSGKKSYGLSFSLRDDNKTLTDQVVDSVMHALIAKFTGEVGAEIR